MKKYSIRKTLRTRLLVLAITMLGALALGGCDQGSGSTEPADLDGDGYDDTVDCDDTNVAIYPGAEEICGDYIDNSCSGEIDAGCIDLLSHVATVPGASVAEVTEAIADYVNDIDDTTWGAADDWIVAGAEEVGDEDVMEATLNLPGGTKIIEVCNKYYAGMAMSFGGHHGVALPCEISVNQVGDDVEVYMLNPEGIFSVFFQDIPAEAAEGMGQVAAVVRSDLETLIMAGLGDFQNSAYPLANVGPSWKLEELAPFLSNGYSIEMELAIPAEYSDSDEAKAMFKELVINQILDVATYEGAPVVGSQVEGLSTGDWRSARPYALGLPGGTAVLEMCSPYYAGAAMSTGAHHAPALPCEAAIWVDGEVLRVHLLDPNFIFPVFFSDADPEMMAQMGPMAAAVGQDLTLIFQTALDSL